MIEKRTRGRLDEKKRLSNRRYVKTPTTLLNEKRAPLLVGHPDLTAALIEHAVQAELVLGAIGRKDREPDLSYLQQPVRYDGDDKLLDTENEAVMMDWEAPLMKRHAEVR